MTFNRRTVVKSIGAALLFPHVGRTSAVDPAATSWREAWARRLPELLSGHMEYAARKYGDSPRFEPYVLATRDLLAVARRHSDSRERMRAADAVPGEWQHELTLDDDDARVLADTMSSWPGVGVYAYARQLCPYSVATILLRREIAWTELIDSPSLIALDWQAKRRRVLPPLIDKCNALQGRCLSLRGVGLVARGTRDDVALRELTRDPLILERLLGPVQHTEMVSRTTAVKPAPVVDQRSPGTTIRKTDLYGTPSRDDYDQTSGAVFARLNS